MLKTESNHDNPNHPLTSASSAVYDISAVILLVEMSSDSTLLLYYINLYHQLFSSVPQSSFQ